MAQCQEPGSVTSHGKAGDTGIFPFPGHGEEILDEAGEFLCEKGFIPVAVFRILIEVISAGCGDYAAPVLLRIPLYAAVSDP